MSLLVTEVKKLYAGWKLAVNTASGYIIPKIQFQLVDSIGKD